jgi:hypothetical protein
MLKGNPLRIFLLLALLISTSSLACVPCDTEANLMVTKQAKPMFPKSYSSTEIFGQATFKIDVSAPTELTKIQILQLTPSDLPIDVITEMIKNSGYMLMSDKKGHAACSVKDFELTFEFSVPQKLEFELDLGI